MSNLALFDYTRNVYTMMIAWSYQLALAFAPTIAGTLASSAALPPIIVRRSTSMPRLPISAQRDQLRGSMQLVTSDTMATDPARITTPERTARKVVLVYI